jgi:hypothetical protein
MIYSVCCVPQTPQTKTQGTKNMSRLRHEPKSSLAKPTTGSFAPGLDDKDAVPLDDHPNVALAKERRSIGVIGGEKAKPRMDRKRGGKTPKMAKVS